MSPPAPVREDFPERFPRVSGDEPSGGGQPEHLGGFSPRERG